MATVAEGRPKDDQTGNEGKFPHEERAEVEVIGTGIEVRELMWMDVPRISSSPAGFSSGCFRFLCPGQSGALDHDRDY
jgi:hypothetical protein